MKIMVTSHTGIGGIARTAEQMHRHVLARHREHELVILYENRRDKSEYKKRYRNTSVYSMPTPEGVHSFTSLTKLKKQNMPVIDKMVDIIRAERPDIVLIIGTFYFPWFLLNAAKKAKRPFIIRYGGIIEMEETKKIWLRMGKDFVNPHYHYVFPSYHSKQTVEGIHKIKLPHSWVIHNGLPDEFFREKSKKAAGAKRKFKIGYVGRHYGVKNPEFCLALADELKSSNSSHIEMVSSYNSTNKRGKKKYPKSVKRFIKAGIKITPPMSMKQLANFYRRKDLIISPSHFETYGYVPLEAIASGTPALINSTLGIREVFIKLGLEDLIADFTDMNDVLDKIEKIKNQDIAIDSGISRHLREKYHFSNTMHEFLDTFEQVLSSAQ